MAKNQSIQTFKSNVIDTAGLARPNLFKVILDFPANVKSAVNWKKNTGGKYQGSSVTELGEFVCRAAQLPSSTIGVVEVPFRGRMLKIAGDRTFEPWTVTIMNDHDYKLRSAFEVWIGMIQETDHNFSNLGITTPKTGTGADGKPQWGYDWMTTSQVLNLSKQFGAGLMQMDLIPEVQGEGKAWRMLGIQSKNRKEWNICHMGNFMSGGTTVALYDTLGPDAARFVCNQTELVTVCASSDLVAGLINLKADDPDGKMASLKNIVSFESDVPKDLLS